MHPLAHFTPNQAQTLSKMANRYPANYPKVLAHGKGGRVFSANGAEYIDLISALGAVSVGYCNPYVNQVVERQMNSGMSFSLPTELEYLAAKKLTELVPGTDMWKFGKNGTDGTVMAVRAARAFTGRTKIMTVGYNGCADQFEIKGVRNAGIPKELEDTITKAEYNKLSTFSDILLGHYACVLLEPMVFEYPHKGFLETLRSACDNSGTLLIFDEVVCGGRFEPFTGSHHFGVIPDLYVLGKAIANGLPLCAVGGTRRLMSVFERDDFFASGTFGGECLSLAAFMATQELLQKQIPKMVENGKSIMSVFNSLFGRAKCEGYPTRLNFKFPTEAHKYLFWQEMCKNGVLVGYTNFIMADHTKEDVDKILTAIKDSHKTMVEYWDNPIQALEGPMPSPAIRKN